MHFDSCYLALDLWEARVSNCCWVKEPFVIVREFWVREFWRRSLKRASFPYSEPSRIS